MHSRGIAIAKGSHRLTAVNLAALRAWTLAGAILASLAPYVAGTPATRGYLISVGAVMLAISILIVDERLLGAVFVLLRRTLVFWVLTGTLLATQLALALFGELSFWGLAKTGGYVVVLTGAYFVMAVAARQNPKTVWPAVSLGLAAVSAFGILGSLGLVRRGVLPWNIPVVGVPPTRSVLYDQNYLALVTFIGVVTAFYGLHVGGLGRSRRFWWTVLSIQFAGLFFAYSRAAILALAAAGSVWLIARDELGSTKRTLIVMGLLASAALFTLWALSSEFMRAFFQISMSLTGREILWPLALSLIYQHPILGLGVGNIGEVLYMHTGQWLSSHNTFLDFALMTGLTGGVALLLFIFVSAGRLFFAPVRGLEKRFLLTALAGLLVINQFITFTPGGAGFGSLVFAIMLGQANAAARHLDA